MKKFTIVPIAAVVIASGVLATVAGLSAAEARALRAENESLRVQLHECERQCRALDSRFNISDALVLRLEKVGRVESQRMTRGSGNVVLREKR